MTLGRLEGKVAVVTGGAGGIGRETARLFVDEGARVVVVDLDHEQVTAAAAELGTPYRVLGVAADVGSEPDVARLVAAALDAFGCIDVLFANAGIEGTVTPLVATELAVFERVQRVNVTGVFLSLKHVLPVMHAQRSGSVIVTSSVGGFHAAPGLSPYVASKHAVIGLTKSAAVESAEFGVRVNSIHPSAVNTRMMRSLEAGFSPDDAEGARRDFAAAIPLGRYGEPIDIARLVLFLAGDESTFISGAQYRIDGGQGAT